MQKIVSFLSGSHAKMRPQILVRGLKQFSFFIAIFLSWNCILECQSAIVFNPSVKTADGIMIGESGESYEGKPFHKFWCVPFGKAKRFEPATRVDPWEGTKDTTFCDTICPQAQVIQAEGFSMPKFYDEVEDCLILNIFTPIDVNYAEPLPVMFYIHGGYFLIGSSLMYSGEIFLDERVVVITINYRLGAFGFLTTNDGEIDGNLGLKDMVLALEWVQRNVKYFGGDPNKVTIFGESAGAGAVGHLVLSPMAKGLFHRAISQSGGVLAPWSFQSRPEQVFQEFVALINCTADTTKESVECLKSKSVDEISMNQGTKWFAEVLFPTFPAVETFPPRKSKVFLPSHPLTMLKEGNFNKVPFINGVCEDEGAYQGGLVMHDEELLESLNHNWITNGAVAVGMDTRNVSAPKLNAGLRKLRQFYFGDDDINKKQHLYKLVDMFSDAWFMQALAPTIKYFSKHAPIWPYVFAKKSEVNLANVFGHFDRPMTSHGDDVIYLFMKGVVTRDQDIKFMREFVKLWVSFAYHGVPNATFGSATEWPPATPGTLDYKFYILDEDTKLVVNPYKDRFRLWLDLADNEWNEFLDLK